MYKHVFLYYLIEEYKEITKDVLEKVKQIKLEKDKQSPDMNLNSFHSPTPNDFKKFINRQLDPFFKKQNLKLKDCWVQKYEQYGFHSLHIHNPNESSFVWFIEGDKDSASTVFYDVGHPYVSTNQSIEFNFTPGTVLIFPGFLPHEVRPNKNKNRLIVSGNLI